MNDYEKVKSLLTELGVDFYESLDDGLKSIYVDSGNGPKNQGGAGFTALFAFDAEGKFEYIEPGLL